VKFDGGELCEVDGGGANGERNLWVDLWQVWQVWQVVGSWFSRGMGA
jgi:hypothetical protein